MSNNDLLTLCLYSFYLFLFIFQADDGFSDSEVESGKVLINQTIITEYLKHLLQIINNFTEYLPMFTDYLQFTEYLQCLQNTGFPGFLILRTDLFQFGKYK
jgi:hypothetical protein